MYQLIIYIPKLQCDKVIQAMFDSGAGRYKHYDHCCWKVLGQGQFRPLTGSQPFIGEQQKETIVDEYRVEMICEKHYLKPAIEAMIKAHPYEEPAYTILQQTEVDLKIGT